MKEDASLVQLQQQQRNEFVAALKAMLPESASVVPRPLLDRWEIEVAFRSRNDASKPYADAIKKMFPHAWHVQTSATVHNWYLLYVDKNNSLMPLFTSACDHVMAILLALFFAATGIYLLAF